jgi:hypothetical protein
MVHRRHAHHAAASSRHQPSPTAAATAQSDASAGGELQLRAKLQQWQRVAKLTPQAAHQLLREQPHLRALLQSSELRPSNLLVNLACLSLRASELQAEQHTELRGLLALLPPSLLQESLGAEHSLLHRQLAWHRQGQQQQEQLSTAQRVRQLRDCLLQSLGPARMQPLAMVAQQQRGRPGPEQPAASALHPLYQSAPLQQQQQQEQHLLRPQLRRQQQQQHQHQHHSFSEQRQHPQQGWQGLAEVIVRAIGLHPSEPLDEHSLSRTVQAQLLRGRSSTSSSAGSSSTSGSEQLRGSSPSRAFASSAGLTVAQGLAHALEHTSRAGRLSGKPVHDADAAAQLAQQLQQVGGGDKHAVLQLLLRRPIVLWQHATPHPPGDVLAELQQLLPPLQQRNGVLQLVQQAPALLSCSREQLASAAELLLGRLQLSRPQLAGLVLRHPKLLLTAPKQMSANVGFLVALGLRPVELQAMALKEPRWLTTSLRDLSVQWHFTQQVLKVSSWVCRGVDASAAWQRGSSMQTPPCRRPPHRASLTPATQHCAAASHRARCRTWCCSRSC